MIRMGILGAARIVPMAIGQPARQVAGVELEAIAARDTERAKACAAKNAIKRVLGSYDELLDDPAIDAVYIPLPNSHHAQWAIKAVEAGKHALVEKPFASNAEQAQRMADAARASGRLMVEAMHYRYHPFATKMKEVLARPALGKIRRVEAFACFPVLRGKDIRYDFALGGGAAMDLGCYAINLARYLVGEEPRVVSVDCRLANPRVDRWMAAELAFPGGATGRVTCSIWSTDFLKGDCFVETDAGRVKIANPLAPQFFNAITWTEGGSKKTEKVPDKKGTAVYQLDAFARAIETGAPLPTSADDAVRNMRVIDAMYQAAGLSPRGTE